MSKIKKPKPEGDAFGHEELSMEKRMQIHQKMMENAKSLADLSDYQFFSTAPLLSAGIDKDPAQIYFNMADLVHEELFVMIIPRGAMPMEGIGKFGSMMQAIVKEYWEDFSGFVQQQAFVDREKHEYWEVELSNQKVLDPLSQVKIGALVLPYELPIFLPSGNVYKLVIAEADTPPPSLMIERLEPDVAVVKRAEKELGSDKTKRKQSSD